MLEMVRTPQYVEIGRVLRVSDGTATFRINLLPFQLQAGDILVIPENTYIEITDMSDDFNAQTVSHQHLSIGFPRCTQWHLSDNDFARIGRYLDLIWEVVHQDAFSPATVEHMLSALMEDLKRLHKQVVPRFSSHQTHGEQIMQHFLDLVAAHGATERKVAFYAEQLRLTPNHLSSVIRQQSGQTVMQWLNERTILQAKVLLKHSDLSSSDIAFRLGFTEATLFSRFFRRETDMTPKEYRER
jgi:AraC-like DNA-binding protein